MDVGRAGLEVGPGLASAGSVGLVARAGGAVVDEQGKSVPFEWEVTGWWLPEKASVKWLLLH